MGFLFKLENYPEIHISNFGFVEGLGERGSVQGVQRPFRASLWERKSSNEVAMHSARLVEGLPNGYLLRKLRSPTGRRHSTSGPFVTSL